MFFYRNEHVIVELSYFNLKNETFSVIWVPEWKSERHSRLVGTGGGDGVDMESRSLAIRSSRSRIYEK